MLKRWFRDGGVITSAAALELADETQTSFIDYAGAGMPIVPLEPTVETAGGLLAAAAQGDTKPFDELARQLTTKGFALAELGAPPSLWSRACCEGKQLWGAMRPGILTSSDGETTSGLSPSGTPRGDRFITMSEALADGGGERLRALASVEQSLTAVGVALNTSLCGILVVRTDPFFACFPGGGAAYGAHFDGGGVVDGCKLTSIVYANADWRDEMGGELHLLDEPSGCWRAVQPRADRIVFFRSDDVLHRVQPTHAQRFALTAWWFADTKRGERAAPGRMRVVRSCFPPGDPQRVIQWDGGGATCQTMARGLLHSMRREAG